MQSDHSVEVIKRFFQAIYELKSRKIIRGKKTFTDRYNINRWNFNKLEAELHRDIFQVAWLAYLINDYGVSPEWLLTGRGEMFTGRVLIEKRLKAQ